MLIIAFAICARALRLNLLLADFVLHLLLAWCVVCRVSVTFASYLCFKHWRRWNLSLLFSFFQYASLCCVTLHAQEWFTRTSNVATTNLRTWRQNSCNAYALGDKTAAMHICPHESKYLRHVLRFIQPGSLARIKWATDIGERKHWSIQTKCHSLESMTTSIE